MADMTTKHYKLIADAIGEGVKEVMNSTVVLEKYPLGNPQRNFLARTMVNEFVHSFSQVLTYTNDKFEKEAFRTLVQAAVETRKI
jgi:hypothetical protein